MRYVVTTARTKEVIKGQVLLVTTLPRYTNPPTSLPDSKTLRNAAYSVNRPQLAFAVSQFNILMPYVWLEAYKRWELVTINES